MRVTPSRMMIFPMMTVFALGAGAVIGMTQMARAQNAEAPAPANTTPSRAPAVLNVTGQGVVRSVPDMAELSIGVTSSADTAAAALAENSEALTAVIEKLKQAGIEERNLQTAGMSVTPEWSNSYSSSSSEGDSNRITGYSAQNMLSVQVLAIGDLGAILDAAVSTGANSVHGPSFGLQDPRQAEDKARLAAVADARVKGELLAEAMGMKLGALVSLTDGAGYGGMPSPAYRLEAASASVPVQIGEVATSAAVSVVWELLPKD